MKQQFYSLKSGKNTTNSRTKFEPYSNSINEVIDIDVVELDRFKPKASDHLVIDFNPLQPHEQKIVLDFLTKLCSSSLGKCLVIGDFHQKTKEQLVFRGLKVWPKACSQCPEIAVAAFRRQVSRFHVQGKSQQTQHVFNRNFRTIAKIQSNQLIADQLKTPKAIETLDQNAKAQLIRSHHTSDYDELINKVLAQHKVLLLGGQWCQNVRFLANQSAKMRSLIAKGYQIWVEDVDTYQTLAHFYSIGVQAFIGSVKEYRVRERIIF